MKFKNCNVLITGASAGIGCEFARCLADRARSMILIARRDDRLVALADELHRRYPKLVVYIRQVDLADLVGIEKCVEIAFIDLRERFEPAHHHCERA